MAESSANSTPNAGLASASRGSDDMTILTKTREKNNRCYRGKQKGGMKVPYNSRILGLVIGAERVKHGMTQEQLSGLAGITHGHLAVLESGQKSPKVETLWRIADALTLRLSDLIKLVEKEMEKGSGP